MCISAKVKKLGRTVFLKDALARVIGSRQSGLYNTVVVTGIMIPSLDCYLIK